MAYLAHVFQMEYSSSAIQIQPRHPGEALHSTKLSDTPVHLHRLLQIPITPLHQVSNYFTL